MVNAKKEQTEIECLRTVTHVGDTGHHPLRKITIERFCIIKHCSNHSITIIQPGKKKQQIPKEEENWK